MKKYLDLSGLQEFTEKLVSKLKTMFATKSQVGSPLVASLASQMTDHTKIYVYTGSETGYTSGNWYYYNGSSWTSGGVYNSVAVSTDKTLSVSDMAADAETVGNEIAELKSDLDDVEEQLENSGLSSATKSALLQLAQKVAYIDDNGQSYYNDLYDALYPFVVYTSLVLDKSSLSFGMLDTTQTLTATTVPKGGPVTWSSSDTSVATVSQVGTVTAVGYGNAIITATCGNLTATCSISVEQATVVSISAVYTQSGSVYESDALDTLKKDLVVTATWSNGTTSTVARGEYTLSGTLAEGTSIITVTYSGVVTTFNVTVSEYYIVATQGNDFIATPSLAANRCSVRVKNRRVAPQDTLSVGCASGYQIYRYAIYADSEADDNGTLAAGEKDLHTKAKDDTNNNVHNNDIKNNVSPKQNVARDWSTDATTIRNTFAVNGITVGVIGFVIRKSDNSNITPQEAVDAITITGHTPLE